MAVESRRATYLAPQLIQNRMLANDDIHMSRGARMEGFALPTNVQQSCFQPFPSPSANQMVIAGVGSNNAGRKRSHHQMEAADFSQQLNQLQTDSNLLISDHIKKMKLETELRFKHQMRLIVTSFREKAIDKIKEHEAKIQEMRQMNVVLQDKAVTLSMENQAWRNLAKEKEETANVLRHNLVQMITHARVTLEAAVPGGGSAVADDGCHSFCGSNAEGEEQEVEMLPVAAAVAGGDQVVCGGDGGRMCLSCGRIESCVLLLPCRHLCLCQVCGATLPTACRVCGTECNGSIRVNLC